MNHDFELVGNDGSRFSVLGDCEQRDGEDVPVAILYLESPLDGWFYPSELPGASPSAARIQYRCDIKTNGSLTREDVLRLTEALMHATRPLTDEERKAT